MLNHIIWLCGVFFENGEDLIEYSMQSTPLMKTQQDWDICEGAGKKPTR